MCKMCGIMMRNNIQIWLIRLFDNVAKSSCKSPFMVRFIGKIVQFCRGWFWVNRLGFLCYMGSIYGWNGEKNRRYSGFGRRFANILPNNYVVVLIVVKP